MATLRQNQAELSDVPRRHGQGVGQLSLIASELIPAYVAVAALVSTRAQLPTSSSAIGIGVNRAQIGDRVRVAVPGELVENSAWNWVNGPVRYATTTGVLSQGGTGAIIGIAIAPTKVLVVNAIYASLEATFANGSVSAPSIAATADLDTGIYWPAADALGITIGGVLSGKFTTRTLYVGDGVSNSAIYSSGGAGSVSDMVVATNGSPRWVMRRNQVAESGSNAGSNFELLARTDAGALIDAPITIARAAGGSITIARPTGFGANAVTGSAIAFTGGSINNVTVGATTATTGRFTTLQSTGLATLASVNIDGGNIDSTAIGATTPSTIVGTTLKASAAASLTDTPIGKSGDPNTGINFPAADQVSLVAGGVSVLEASAANVRFPVGVDFGSEVAASATDLSRHLALWGTTYGLNVISNTLNYVVPTGASHVFGINGVTQLTVSATAVTSATKLKTLGSTSLTDLDIGPSGDANTGISFPAADTLDLVTGGVKRLSISTSVLTIGPTATTEQTALQVGEGRTGSGFAYLDLVGDTTYTDYGLRVIRGSTGANTTSQILHKGTGVFSIGGETAGSTLSLQAGAATVVLTASSTVVNVPVSLTRAGNTVWDAGNDGSGSGLDADTVDTIEGADLPRVIARGSLTGGASTTINVPAGSWKKIELVLHNVTDSADFSGYLRINNDSTVGNYRYAYTITNLNAGTNGVAGGSTTATAFNLWSSSSNIEATSNKFGCKFTIHDPASSTIRKNCVQEVPGTIAAIDGVPYGMLTVGAMWLGTAAVTSLVVSWKNTAGASPTGSDTTPDTGDYTLIGYL